MGQPTSRRVSSSTNPSFVIRPSGILLQEPVTRPKKCRKYQRCFSELLKAPRGVSKIRGDFPELHMKAEGGPGSQGLPDYPGSSEDLGVHRI